MTLLNQKPFADAYGEELWSYFKTGEPKREIIEREDGLISLGQVGGGLYFSEYKNWSKIEKAAMKYVKGRVLDIGCGAGRHSLYLQGKGFDVTRNRQFSFSDKSLSRPGIEKGEADVD